jgi:hypothetical protein
VPVVDPAVADLDVNFARNLSPDYWDKRRSVWSLACAKGTPLDSPKLRELIGTSPVLFKGPVVRVVPHERAEVLATLTPPGGGSGEKLPAIVAHTYGQGRVVFFAAGVDAANYQYAFPYHRELLARALAHAAAAPPPIEVAAPLCVHAVSMRQRKDGERLIVHLYNDVNTTAHRARPEDDVPLREETLPIHDLRVTFRGYAPTRVHLEPGAVDLPMEHQGEAVTVVVPRLDVHAMVVAELP